ncbi:MAG TPA: hypothetical protein VGO80_17445 [Solirubrobacteraceae bacterium]|jgi:hypothetical protein|nr:hypothetical protein [Solirubrobacteraceae bacterium]
MSDAGLWLTLAALGAYHGLNPAMGWLFAVSQGLQQRERRAVLRALAPIALGHELSIVLVAAIVLGAAAVIEPRALHVSAAAVLLAFGIFRFVRPRAHPRWTTMRVNRRELALWSFLMSTAHGAGLMVAPLLIGLQGAEAADAHQHNELGLVADVPLLSAGLGIAVHVAAMLLVMAIVALLVYEKLGLKLLSRAWLNTDGIWAATFVLAAGITFFT